MSFQMVFKRYEVKYLMSKRQQQQMIEAMKPYMEPDQYGRVTIRNIYYDTDTYLLIRRSLEKPIYKEKLRIRSYGTASPQSPVFVELKKKYKGVVYKRRVCLAANKAFKWISLREDENPRSQITEEINYVLDYYENLHPVVHLSYDREAYYAKDGSDFRVTFDDHILYRQEELNLWSENYGTPILPEDQVLMELKCPGSIPLWMTEILSREKIYKQSFSKYGTAYNTMIKEKEIG